MHYSVITYLGARCYDNRGAWLDTFAKAEAFARKCSGGSGRSGAGCTTEIVWCNCTNGTGRDNTLPNRPWHACQK